MVNIMNNISVGHLVQLILVSVVTGVIRIGYSKEERTLLNSVVTILAPIIVATGVLNLTSGDLKLLKIDTDGELLGFFVLTSFFGKELVSGVFRWINKQELKMFGSNTISSIKHTNSKQQHNINDDFSFIRKEEHTKDE